MSIIVPKTTNTSTGYKYPEKPDKAFALEWLKADQWPAWDCVYILSGKKPEKHNYHSDILRARKLLIDQFMQEIVPDYQDTGTYNPFFATVGAYQCIGNLPSLVIETFNELYEESKKSPLKYYEGCPIYDFYHHWGMRDNWILKEAVCVVSEIDPENLYNQPFRQGVMTHTPEKRLRNILFPMDKHLFDDRYQLVKSCVGHSLHISGRSGDASYLIRPLEFLNFCDKKRIPYKPLLRHFVEEQAGVVPKTPDSALPQAPSASNETPARERGRPAKFDKEAWGVEIFRYYQQHGKLPESKNELLNHLKAFEEKQTGQTPGDTTISEFISPYYEAIENHEK